MIDYDRLIFIGSIVIILFGSGFWVGNSRYVRYKAEVEFTAKTQEEKVKSIRTQQELINKGIQDEYDAKLALIRQYYANGVRQSSSSKLPPNSGITTQPFDALASYNVLAEQCAETTQQLVSLQAWLNEQMGIK